MASDQPGEADLVDVHDLFMFLRSLVPDDSVIPHDRAYLNNLAYSLQYVDHLLTTIADPELRPTIHSQTCKSLVLAGMGIVEAILWYVVKKSGHANSVKWREISKQTGSSFKHLGSNLRIETMVLEEVSPPLLEEMTLDTLIKKVESRALLGLSGHKVYGTLKALRKLRNRIHIHGVEAQDDTDWYKFTGREVVMLLNALNDIFATSVFSSAPHHVDLLKFLDPSRVERHR